MSRLFLTASQRQKFFKNLKKKNCLSWEEIATEIGVSLRALRDWRVGKYSLPLEKVRKLEKKFGAIIPRDTVKRPQYWYVRKAGRLGAVTRNKKYGNPGTPEGRSKGGKTTCQRLHSNPEFARRIGFSVRKKIYYPQKSPKLAELIGILIGDGGITSYQVRVTLNKETDKNYEYFVARLFRDLFHVKSTIKEEKNEKTCGVVVSSRNLAEYLIRLGLKRGNKINQQIDIPDWIKKDKKLKMACLRGLIDTDGCFYVDIHKIKDKYYFNPGIVFTTYSLPLFLSVKRILKDFNYHSTGERRNIFLRREDEIIRYFKEVKFSNQKHISKFKDFVKNHRQEILI